MTELPRRCAAAVALAVILTGFLGDYEARAQDAACHLLDTSDPITPGFGAPYDVLSPTGELLLQVLCDDAGATISVGTGIPTQYVYRYGYEWKDNRWRPIELSGSDPVGDAWFVGRAQATLPRTPEELARDNFFLAYVCSWVGGQWKCGCRDQACATGSWQLQGFRSTEDSSGGQRQVGGGTGGFGTDTRGGLEGRVIKVTNLNDRGPGSLREAIQANGPRTVVFEVSGTIRLASNLVLTTPDITIAGETAPSPGITVAHGTLKIKTHDVVIRHLRFRVGDKTRDGQTVSGNVAGNLDAISIENNSSGTLQVYNIVLDNISLSWAIDENLVTWFPTIDNVTVRDSIIAEPLHASVHPKGEHGMGVLIGAGTGRVSLARNLIYASNDRQPWLQSQARAVVLNNVVHNPGWSPMTVSGPDTWASYVGNVLLRGPSSGSWVDALLKPHPRTPLDGVRLYLRDNTHPGPAPTTGFPAGAVVAELPVWHASHDAEVMPATEAPDAVLSQAGARPGDRDEVDRRVVESVRGGTGRIINSQDEVGGYPVLAENRRALNPPAAPQGDDDGDGVNNLAEWLNGFRRQVGEQF